MRILIVDDYPGLVEHYDLALAARGFEVVGANTVGEALMLAVNDRFDAVVLDVELPDGSGSDLAQRLRNIPSLEKARFIGMSSFPGKSIDRFDAFLAKPFHPKQLASLLRRLCPSAAEA